MATSNNPATRKSTLDAQERARAMMKKQQALQTQQAEQAKQAAEKAKQAKLAEQAKPTLTPLQQAQQMKQKVLQNQQAVQARLAQEKVQHDAKIAESNAVKQRANEELAKTPELLAWSRQALEDARMGRPINAVPPKSYTESLKRESASVPTNGNNMKSGTPKFALTAAEQAQMDRLKLDKTTPIQPTVIPTRNPGTSETPKVITDPVRPTPTSGRPTTSGAPMPAGGGGAPAPGTERMVSAPPPPGAVYKKGGNVKRMASGNMKSVTKMASGGSVSKASSRGDGIAQRGKTRGRML